MFIGPGPDVQIVVFQYLVIYNNKILPKSYK